MLLPVRRGTVLRGWRPKRRAVPFSRRLSSRGSSAGGLRGAAQEEGFDVPQCVWLDDDWLEISYIILGADQDVRRGKENERLVFVNDLLYAVVILFSFFKIPSVELLLHQLVYFGFPSRHGMSLRRVPKM